MKTKLIFLIFLTLLSVTKKAFSRDSYCLRLIQIEGYTNINRFFFTYQDESTKTCTPLPDGMSSSDIMNFDIPVKAFQSSNPAMTKDFLQLLKANEYPKVIVGMDKFIMNEIHPYSSKEMNIYITLAGKKRTVKVNCQVSPLEDNKISIKGETQVHLTDFSLTPPEKAFGLIRVKDLVIIKFDIIINV